MTAPLVDVAPALRRLPIPLAEPRPALRVLPESPPPVPPAQGVLPLVGTSGRSRQRPADGAVRPCAPSARAWAHQFVQAALEVISGRRPVVQLVRWTTEEVYATLSRRAALAQRFDRSTSCAPSAVVRSVHLCQPADGVVEASAVVIDRGRVRAVALRLDALAGRWQVSVLEII
ncbi:MAG TPA: Rv3235 family protein [Kineosporiaceae bacterium]